VPYFLKGTKVTNQSLLLKSIVHFTPEQIVHYMPECPRGLCSAPRQKNLFYLKKLLKSCTLCSGISCTHYSGINCTV